MSLRPSSASSEIPSGTFASFTAERTGALSSTARPLKGGTSGASFLNLVDVRPSPSSRNDVTDKTVLPRRKEEASSMTHCKSSLAVLIRYLEFTFKPLSLTLQGDGKEMAKR